MSNIIYKNKLSNWTDIYLEQIKKSGGNKLYVDFKIKQKKN